MKPPEADVCPQCGRTIPAGASDGLCPACVARFSFGLGATGAAPFAPTEASSVSQLQFAPPSRGRFGDYELLEEIGRGGMGIVYRARQRSLNRIVAVKMIPFGPWAGEEAVRRFRAEAEAAGCLQHPNIIAIHEVGECDGQHFFSMDYVEGGTLADLLHRGPLPARRAAEHLRTLAQAVHYAHQRGILHRDLKPSNILMDRGGQPRISDFGLAKRLPEKSGIGNRESESELTVTGQLLGSPNYMPPEQASAKHGPVSTRSDVYALGAILYHALTGYPPFQGESVEVVLARLASEDPMSLRLLNAAVPRDLETVSLKCLMKEPSRRYGTALELADELGRFLQDEPILAKPASRPEKMWRWCRRKPAAASALGLLVLLLFVGVGGALGVFRQWRRAEVAAVETRRNLYAADMELAYQAFLAGDLGHAQHLLENHLPGPAPRDRDIRGWEWRYLWQQCRGQESFILGRHDGAVPTLDYSPDGRLLASADVRGTLKIWDVAARRSLLATNLTAGRINALVFSPDAKLLAHTTARSEVWLWDTVAWNRVGTLPHLAVSHLAFAPDGKTLLTASGLEMWQWNVETRKGRRLLEWKPGRFAPGRVAFAPDGRTLAIADVQSGGLNILDWPTRSGRSGRASWIAHAPLLDQEETLTALSFSPKGDLLATTGADRTVRLWEINGHFIGGLSNHNKSVTCAAFSPDGHTLASGSLDQTVRWWDVTARNEGAASYGHAGGCLAVRFAPDGQSLASAGLDGLLKVWSLRSSNTLANPVKALPPGVKDVVLFPNPALLAIKTPGSTWQVWSLPGFDELHRGTHVPGPDYASLKGVSSGLLLEAVGNKIQFRHLADGRIEPFVTADVGEGLSLDLSRDGRTLAASGKDRIAAWDVASRQLIRRWETPDEGLGRHVRVCPNGRAVVTLQKFDGTVTFLDLAGTTPKVLRGHMLGEGVLNFSPDGQRLATAGLGAAIRIYDVVRGEQIMTLEGGSSHASALAFAFDTKRLACGSPKGSISIWDLETRREVALLAGHQHAIQSLAFLDTETLASVANDEVRLWRAPSLATIERLRQADTAQAP